MKACVYCDLVGGGAAVHFFLVSTECSTFWAMPVRPTPFIKLEMIAVYSFK